VAARPFDLSCPCGDFRRNFHGLSRIELNEETVRRHWTKLSRLLNYVPKDGSGTPPAVRDLLKRPSADFEPAAFEPAAKKSEGSTVSGVRFAISASGMGTFELHRR